MHAFNKKYAQIYDIFYAEKNYESEVDFIERVINKYKPGAKNILDYGCGTGNHAKLLAPRGYKVFCLDKNENMLEITRQKLKKHRGIQLYNTNERDKISPNSIDVCITLFDVVSYMNTNKEINDFLSYVKKILTKNGLFIFDFWYGPGVMNLKPEQRWKKYKTKNKNILRLTKPNHNIENCIVDVNHEVIVWSNNKILDRFSDNHNMRYFFKNELELFLNYNKFKIIKFGTFKNINISPTIKDWSALIICKS